MFKTNSGTQTLDSLFVRKDALLSVGSLWLWGQNSMGQLGDNTSSANKSSPVQTVAGGNNWKTLTDNGSTTMAAIKNDGSLWLWGNGNQGQIGDNNLVSRSSPVQTICQGTNWKQVSCGYNHTAAVKTDGSLWLWGGDNYGQLGDNTTAIKVSPVQTIAGGNNWAQVSCGRGSTAAIKTDGSLWAWGNNRFGQLGDNTANNNKSSPVQTIAGGNNWAQVACGYGAAAIKTDGSLWLWGYNYYGQLGDGTTLNKSSPVQTIAGGNNWKRVSVSTTNAMAIKTDGSLWTWGFNYYGQLGDGTTLNKSSPVQTIAGGNNWKQASLGTLTQHTAAIKTDGSLWLWGQNTDGQLGDGTVATKSSPVQTIVGGTNWKSVAGGGSHIAALK